MDIQIGSYSHPSANMIGILEITRKNIFYNVMYIYIMKSCYKSLSETENIFTL